MVGAVDSIALSVLEVVESTGREVDDEVALDVESSTSSSSSTTSLFLRAPAVVDRSSSGFELDGDGSFHIPVFSSCSHFKIFDNNN